MTAAHDHGRWVGADGTHPTTLVWIDAREAIIVRWWDGQALIDRVESEVPAHRRLTGHVRHDPTVRHGGGGGSPQDAGEARRQERLTRFTEHIATSLAPDDDLLILGPGTVRERLERLVRDIDTQHMRRRAVTCEASTRRTDRQLIARLRRSVGIETPRRVVSG